MKKLLLYSTYFNFNFWSSACGHGTKAMKMEKKLVVGASNVPHAEILEKAKPLLEEKGIELEIETYQDYVLPNKALADKELDANYFQHIPYLEKQIKDNGYDFEIAGEFILNQSVCILKNIRA